MSAHPQSRPDLNSDVVVELHIVVAVGGESPHREGPWAVWVGLNLARRTLSKEDALKEGHRLAEALQLRLWMCEDGTDYQLLHEPVHATLKRRAATPSSS